jgi:predicted nucleic acid-binding protein
LHAEAVTTLPRTLSNSLAADLLNRHFQSKQFYVEYIGEEIMESAGKLYNTLGSKKNTFFNAIVATTAKHLGTDLIFSFDSWYKTQAFTLASELK